MIPIQGGNSKVELVERDHLLEDLRLETRSAAKGSGRLVFLGGDAGLGKSSVVREMARKPGSQVRLMWGACDSLTTPRPLGPLLDMASTAPMVGDLIDRGAPRFELFTSLVEDITTRPSLLVMEDAHWADEATLDLILFLGRRIADTRSIVVVTYRPHEITTRHPLRLVMGDLATAAGHRRFQVEPLSLDGVRTLVGERSIDAERLHRVTGGNPFYVTEVLAKPGWTVPPTVADAVLARVSRLPDEERDLLATVSVEPTGLELDLFESLGRGLPKALASGLVVADGDTIRFRHELARLAIEGTLDAQRRRNAHKDILGELERRDDIDPSRLAHHANGVNDPAAILKWATEAGDAAAASGAHRQAVEHFRDGVEHSVSADIDIRIDLLEKYATELSRVDRMEDALAMRQRVLTLVRRGGNMTRILLAEAHLADAMLHAGDGIGAYRLMDKVVAAADSLDPGLEMAQIYYMAGYQVMLARRAGDAMRWCKRAIALAEEHGGDKILARTLNALGSTRIVSFEDLTGVEELTRSGVIAEELGWDAQKVNALLDLGSGLCEIRRYSLAEDYLQRGIEETADRDLDGLRHYCTAWLSRVRFEQGRWSEADDLASRVPLDSGAPMCPIVAATVMGRTRTRRGESGAEELLNEAWSLAQEAGDVQRLWPVVAARAEWAWLSGGNRGALSRDLLSVLDTAVELGVRWAISELVFWANKLDLPTEHQSPMETDPFRLHVEGEHAAAAMTWAELGCPYEQAWSLVDAGNEESLRQGLDLLISLGAGPLADRARQSLRELGATRIPSGPRPQTTGHPEGLTRRQVEVLGLLTEGMTDKEIAERLFISPKTAGHHVTAILQKLDVSSRHAAASRSQQKPSLLAYRQPT
ncbi:MAG: AAA family ATPase [Acidimicrobiia bacterium]|nr:AAA family ATPase [Acidimicrobiia bacterium]